MIFFLFFFFSFVPQMLHVLGSPTDEYSYHLCLYYARMCAETHTGITAVPDSNGATNTATAYGTATAATTNHTAPTATANWTATAATANGTITAATANDTAAAAIANGTATSATANGTATGAIANGTATADIANDTAPAATAHGVADATVLHPEGIPIFEFRFAVINPSNECWSFPINLTDNSLKEASQVGMDKAVAEIMAWQPDVIHSHMNCHVVYR